MVRVVIPLAMNVLACIAVWMSNLPVIGKIVITVVLAGKYVAYFRAALMDASDRARSFGLVLCILLNALLIVFFVMQSIWFAIAPCALLMIVAIIWGGICGFTFRKED